MVGPAQFNPSDFSVLPQSWRIANLGDIAVVGRGRVISHREIAACHSPLYPVYSSQTSDEGVMGYLDTFEFEGEYVTWTTDGANAGTVFYRNGRFNCTNVCGTIKLHSDDHAFVARMLGIHAPRYVSRHLGNPKLMNDIAKIIQLPLPPLPEQHAIAKALSDADDLTRSLERLIAKKRGLKQAAMQQLLTGQTRLPGFSGEWSTKAFADLFNFSGGYSASREQLSHAGHCYLHYGDIHGSKTTYVDAEADFDSIPKLDVALSQVNKTSLLDDGDVVFVDASEDVDGASRHVVVRNTRGIPFISGLHTIVAKSKSCDLNNQYKRFCFQPEETKRQFRFYAVGTKVSGVSKTNIAKITLRFPCIAEQRAIAEVLSDMDAEITALEARLAKTGGLKQGMMQELLTGRTRLV